MSKIRCNLGVRITCHCSLLCSKDHLCTSLIWLGFWLMARSWGLDIDNYFVLLFAFTVKPWLNTLWHSTNQKILADPIHDTKSDEAFPPHGVYSVGCQISDCVVLHSPVAKWRTLSWIKTKWTESEKEIALVRFKEVLLELQWYSIYSTKSCLP